MDKTVLLLFWNMYLLVFKIYKMCKLLELFSHSKYSLKLQKKVREEEPVD